MHKNLGFKWILIIGGIGFLAGFFGPIFLAPEANQGPLVGIFITGPLGVLLGFAFWLISAAWRWSFESQLKVAGASCAALIFGVVASVFWPKPKWLGRTYEIKVNDCRSSAPGESILETTILREIQFKMDSPPFRPAHITGGELTTKTPQHISFYIAGSCSNYPKGFVATYYVDNHPAAARDKAVLLPVPADLKGH